RTGSRAGARLAWTNQRVPGHRAGSPRDLRAVRNRAGHGQQPRRVGHDGPDLFEIEQHRAVLLLRAVPVQRRHRDAALPLRDRRRLLDRISEQAAAVIYNSMVFEQTQEDSLTDPLTGLPNTRSMFMHLTRELARAERLKSEVSLLVMDLDNFKEINDTFGHHVGDRALRDIATVLRAGIRPYDVCVRYAGDEFIVVLAGCGADEAERKRLELQRAVDGLQ